ncbi:MAG: HAMP domain-containing histidine kinase [Lachnospiraceae bacterium]|nr:HAMP domain-containing histidine kinase [Ruminococcus sp.]MCM1274984.1 HAMP domain-containing histidine kinase [Lachnospiraceae bacterium]
MKRKIDKNRLFGIVNRLGMKLMILTLIIILGADILTFTTTIVIGYVTGGTNDTTQVIASIAASIVIGTLLSFIIGNTVLKPLSMLVKATKRVTGGDYSVRLEMGWIEKHTVRELRELIADFNDMTEELRNTELFRKDFISSFSHEFKTPLASIRGFARQLYSGDLTPEQQREFSKIILDETEYLSVLSQNTLLMTSLENQDIITEKTAFSLDEQLRGCMIRLEPQWSEKNIEIDMEDMEDVSFFWNEQMLAHVWNNLFDNAVKFTPEGGTIRVSCKRENGLIVVGVSDSGCGIPENALPHIFEKFYQADSSHATKGNGLGLPLVKRIVELCGGEISVSSEPGKGTKFTVTLKGANENARLEQ